MKTSPQGLALIENSEGLKLKAYQDVAGVWTNGYGNTHGVIPGSTITQAQAVADLTSNLAGAEHVVNTVVTVNLSQNQFDALVDFVFNLGSGNFQSSTLLRKLNMGDYAGASAEFPKWNHAGGVVVAGLTTRRLAEQALFNAPIVQSSVSASPSIDVAGIAQGITSFFTKIQDELGNT